MEHHHRPTNNVREGKQTPKPEITPLLTRLCVRKINRLPVVRPYMRVNNSLCMMVSLQWKEWWWFACQCEVNLLVECVCGQGLTVLPHSTSSHNCLNYSIKTLKWLDETREDGKSNRVVTHGFPPHSPRFEIPQPYPLESCPFHF